MRLSKNDPLYLDLPDGVEKTLPNWEDIRYLQDTGIAISALKSEIALDNTEIYSRATQIAFGGITTDVGASMVLFDAMTDAMSINVQRVTTDILEQIAGSVGAALGQMAESNDILDTTLEAGVGIAVNLASVVPIVGWIIKIAWNVGNTIAKIIKIARDDEDPKFLYPPTRFSPDADSATLNNFVLSRVRSSDWSVLFYPPGVGAASVSGRRFFVKDLEGGGVRISTANSHADDGWIGFVPGTGWLHQAIEARSAKDVIETGSTYLPSAMQQCGWIWRNVTRTNDPSAFTVHAERAGAMWGQYIEELRVAINESDLSKAMKKAIFKKYDRDGDYPVFDWGDGVSWQPDGYSPVRIMEQLRQRQLDLCDRLVVASISSDFGALQDPAVRSKWEDRRKDLLEHPDVCAVHLEDVPDAVYRGAVEYRQEQRHCDILPPNGKFAAGTGKNPEVVYDGWSSPEGYTFTGVIAPKFEQDGDDNTLAWVLGGLALAGGAAAAYRYRDPLQSWLRAQRRKLPALR